MSSDRKPSLSIAFSGLNHLKPISVIYAVNHEANDDPLIQIRMISSLKPIVVALGGKTENPWNDFFHQVVDLPTAIVTSRGTTGRFPYGQTAQKSAEVWGWILLWYLWWLPTRYHFFLSVRSNSNGRCWEHLSGSLSRQLFADEFYGWTHACIMCILD